MRAAVLGCGPSGMVAAHALHRYGADEVIIYSNGGKSKMFGAQYLHAPIPGIQVPSRHIRYELWGETDGYRRKVYGVEDVEVSPQSLTGRHQVWDIRATYDKLWDMYSSSVLKFSANSSSMTWLTEYSNLDIVFNTIPAGVICRNQVDHKFAGTMIWAAGDAPELGIRVDAPHGIRDMVGTDHVVCSGLPWHPWYRFSNIFDHATIEWPHAGGHDPNRPYPSASRVTKPIAHNCDCWQGSKLVGVGRYGAWHKGILVNNVFDQVQGVLSGAISI